MNIRVANTPAAGPVPAPAAAHAFVLAVRGYVCDRYTTAGMQGARLLAQAAAARLGAPLRAVGTSGSAMNLGWHESLAKAAPCLREAAGYVDGLLGDRRLPLIFANRCGASLATIPAMLRHRPQAKVVWCDAHGDFNTPETTPTGYLGGMVLSALCGLWDSGFGNGLSPDRIVLVGTRDLDPGESELLAAHGVRIVPAKDGAIGTRGLIEAVGGAPLWIHIDTDVVDPLYLPAEYRVAHGLHPAALRALLRDVTRASELVGFEMAEFEAPNDPGRRARAAETIFHMIEPVLLAASGGRPGH